jgi:tRNA-dihydrouridine synthase C
VVSIPVIAHGEIWTAEDASQCRMESGCNALMLGRGIVADPGLALAIRRLDSHSAESSHANSVTNQGDLGWDALLPFVAHFWHIVGLHIAAHHRAGRLKQWLNFLRRRHPQAQEAYAAVRTINDPLLITKELFAHTGAVDEIPLAV